MSLNPGQLSNLRDGHSHIVDTYMAAAIPEVVYCGTVGGAPSRGDRDITCVNVSGNIANVIEGQTIYVGTACEDYSISKRRLRARAGQVLTVDENGVDWQVGDYITVVEYWEPWPVQPRILTTTPYTIYKDYDIAYTDQNEEPPPVAIMGPPWAGFLDGATVAAQLDATDSYAIAPGAAISTYNWITTGGVIAAANNSQTYITFNGVTGHTPEWVSLTVTDSNGKTQTTRRPFWIFARTGANAPYSGFAATVSGNFQAGVTLSFEAFEDMATWPDGTMIVLFTEELFDGVDAPIGGFSDRENIRFVGYIDDSRISIDPEDVGGLTVMAHTVDQVLSNKKMMSISVMDILTTPTTWYQYKNLTIARAIHHLWRWHSTLFTVADVYLPISNTQRRGNADFPENNLLSQARQIATEKSIFAMIGCNKQGVIHCEIDPNMLWETDRGGIDVVQEIISEDWKDRISLVIQERTPVGWGHLSGVLWDGADGTFYHSIMPGEAPEAEGQDSIDIQYQSLLSQADSNEKVGLAYAKKNPRVREVRVPDFAGNYQHIDVYPQVFYEITINAASNKRGVALTARNLIPRDYVIRYQPDGVVSVGANFEPATKDVLEGIPGHYPSGVPTDIVTPDPPKYQEPETIAANVVTFGYGDGCFWGDVTGPTWVARNGARAGGDLDSRHGYWDPWGLAGYGSFNPERAVLLDFGEGYIFRSVDAGRHWYDVTPGNDPPNSWNDSPAPTATDLTYEMGVPNLHTEGTHYIIAWYQNAASAYRGYILVTTDNFASYTWYNLGSDNLSVATWGLGESAFPDLWCDDSDAGNPVRTLLNVNNILQENGAAGGVRVNFTARADNTALFQRILLVDFGTWFQLDPATVDGGVNIESRMTSSADTMTITDDTNVELLTELTRLNWFQCDADRQVNVFWNGGVDGYPFGVPSVKSAAANETDYVRYAWIVMGAPAAARYRGTGHHQHLLDYIKVYPDVVASEVKPLSIDYDYENGKFLYVTTWEGLGIRCRIYDMDTSLTHPVCIIELQPGVSRLQLDLRTYWAVVKASRDALWNNYGDKFLLYGYFNSGDHIWSTYMVNDKFYNVDVPAFGGDDGSWAATEYLASVEWLSQNRIVAIMNSMVGANPEVWETTDYAVTWNLRSAIPFTSGAGKGCEYDGMTIHGGPNNVMGAGDGNGEEIFIQASPWTGAWVEVTPVAAIGTRVGCIKWVFNDIL